MDQNEDWMGLCKYCRRSNYDMVQAHNGAGWGVTWTFVANDVHAAEKAGQQMRRMGASRLRHIMRAHLRQQGQAERSVVIITELPGRSQVVLDMEKGSPVQSTLLMDASLNALEAAVGLR